MKKIYLLSIAAAFFLSGSAALVENALCLAAVMAYIYAAPLDIALNIDSPGFDAAGAARSYKAALPGAVISGFQVVYRMKGSFSPAA